MKTKLLMLFLAFTTITNAQSSGEDCKDLFFSEILRHDTLMPNGHHYGSYSFEVFNPTSSTINLSAYRIQLRKVNNSLHDIIFTSTASIPAKGTYVVSNTNAEATILALSDKDTTLLDTNQYCEAKLLKANGTSGFTTLDIFGQPTTSQQMTFNYLQFMLDPAAYASTYGFPLELLSNIGIRRGYFVTSGVSTFVPIDVLGTWAFYFGGNNTGLGNHLCKCNAEISAVPTVGYQLPLNVTLNKLPAQGQTNDLMMLNWASPSGGFWLLNQNFTAGTAVNLVDISFTSSSSCAVPEIVFNCTNIQCSGFGSLFSGTRSKTVTMTTPFGTCNVDQATKSKFYTIRGNSPAAIKEYAYGELGITIFPTITSDILHIEGNIDCNYSITNLEGKIVQAGALWSESTVNVNNLVNGVYIITFKNYSGTKVDKFVKN